MTNYSDVTNIVYKVGQNLKKSFGNIEASGYKSNSAADVVTKLDKEMEDFYEEELKKLDPLIGFTGEEVGIRQKSDKFWLVDPIDGTGLFLRGVWGCTTMLVLIENGQLEFCAIYDFVLDKMYTAEKGKGAFMNGKPIRVSARPLKEAYIYVESQIQKKENWNTYLNLEKVCIVLASYPAGIHFALTAEGKIEGRICVDPYGKDYDFAPGQLLVQEAGGVVMNIGSNSFDYANLNFLAVNKQVYQDLTEGKDAIFPVNS